MSPSNPIPGVGDNGDVMRESWSAEDTEAVLRGRPPVSAYAARLGPAIASLRSRAHGTTDPSTVAAMASLLAETSRESLAGANRSSIRRAKPASPRTATPWRRRISLAGAVAILASAGLAGTAAAADGAAPGDALYSVDRAFEAVGIGAGGSHERLSESAKLVEGGKVDEALHHAAEALKDEGDASSSAALVAAAEQLAANGSENSAEVHARVAEMIRWMSQADVKGPEFGQAVSSYARGLDGSNGKADDGTPGRSGDNAADGNQGNSGAGGRPDSPGKSGEAGKSRTGDEDVVSPSDTSGDHPANPGGG